MYSFVEILYQSNIRMSTTEESKRSMKRQLIIDHFMNHYLEHGAYPGSVFKFSKDLKIEERDFYQFFGSFKGVEKAIWKDMLEGTITAIKKDKNYQAFSSREKLLSFYFTHLEVVLRFRSFILLNFEGVERTTLEPYFLSSYKSEFLIYARALINEGLESGEIASRKYISDHYEHGFWVQLMFILRFWINDDSAAFEKSDAAVEKAVNLSFDLVARGPVESVVDFAKFVLQNR